MSIEEVDYMDISYIPILYSIAINLDKYDNLDDDEHEIIDLDVDLHNIFSMDHTITSSFKHSDSLGGPSLYLAIVPIVLDITPLESCLPSLITTNQDSGGGKHA